MHWTPTFTSLWFNSLPPFALSHLTPYRPLTFTFNLLPPSLLTYLIPYLLAFRFNSLTPSFLSHLILYLPQIFTFNSLPPSFPSRLTLYLPRYDLIDLARGVHSYAHNVGYQWDCVTSDGSLDNNACFASGW